MSDMHMRKGYALALAEYAATNPDIVVLDADTSSSTMSNLFAERFPERFFNVGIAEPCMIDMAVGFAAAGKIPFANGFAALLSLRALEQVRTCVCYARQNVKLASTYAGLSDYKDGATHHAITDIAILRSLPEMTVIVPADAIEAGLFVPLVAEYDGPVYLRINRSATINVHAPSAPLEIGKGIIRHEGDDVAIVATGSMTGRSVRAAERLAQQGISATVVEIHTIKPLDAELIRQVAARTGAIVTAEEHTVIGGLGSAVTEALCDGRPVPVERVGIYDSFMRTGTGPEPLLDNCGLAITDVVAATERVLKRK
ncbi:MAG: transketolase family protein [Anaerolineae bacterium]|nr:transketolase family protein [Anaerolineae bacterium]